jgi:hypothetical protein
MLVAGTRVRRRGKEICEVGDGGILPLASTALWLQIMRVCLVVSPMHVANQPLLLQDHDWGSSAPMRL